MRVTGGGDLRSRVTFAERVTRSDNAGNMQAEWIDRLTCPAQIIAARGSESLDATRLESRGSDVIRVRFNPATRAIVADWKATDVESGVAYNIRAVRDPFQGTPQHGRWIDCYCEQGLAVG